MTLYDYDWDNLGGFVVALPARDGTGKVVHIGPFRTHADCKDWIAKQFGMSPDTIYPIALVHPESPYIGGVPFVEVSSWDDIKDENHVPPRVAAAEGRRTHTCWFRRVFRRKGGN